MDVTRSHMAWHTPRKAGRDQPSPIVLGDSVLVVSMDGILCCYDFKKGTEMWKDRLNGKFTSSPVAANGLAYFSKRRGRDVRRETRPTTGRCGPQFHPGRKRRSLSRASLSSVRGRNVFAQLNNTLYCLDSSK